MNVYNITIFMSSIVAFYTNSIICATGTFSSETKTFLTSHFKKCESYVSYIFEHSFGTENTLLGSLTFRTY
jgi:hypothetical protein